MAKIKVAFMQDILNQFFNEKISFSRMCELINEKALEAELESGKETDKHCEHCDAPIPCDLDCLKDTEHAITGN